MKVTKAPLLLSGLGLAGVVDERSEAQRTAPGQLVGKRLGEQLAHSRRVLAGESVEVALDLEQLPQHLDRVAVDVEVVVGALLDTAQRFQLREDLAR